MPDPSLGFRQSCLINLNESDLMSQQYGPKRLIICDTCGGLKEVYAYDKEKGELPHSIKCPDCSGTGKCPRKNI